jgi:hypothetical protein
MSKASFCAGVCLVIAVALFYLEINVETSHFTMGSEAYIRIQVMNNELWDIGTNNPDIPIICHAMPSEIVVKYFAHKTVKAGNLLFDEVYHQATQENYPKGKVFICYFNKSHSEKLFSLNKYMYVVVVAFIDSVIALLIPYAGEFW